MVKPETNRKTAKESNNSSATDDSQISANQKPSGWFRRSLGQLSGAGEFSKAIGDIATGAKSSSARIGGMVSSVFGNDPHEAESTEEYGDMHERFKASMKLHRVDGPKLARMVRNTRRNFILYLVLLVLASTISSASFYFHAPDSAFSGLIRISAIPILAALAFKHAYSNWMFRNLRLSPPIEFFRSGDPWPRATGRQISELEDRPARKGITNRSGNSDSRCNPQ